MIDNHTFGIEPPAQPRGLKALYQRDQAAIQAAAWLWAVFLILAVITLFTGWASLGVTLFLQFLVSFASGFLAGRNERRNHPEAPRITRMGALSGFYLVLVTALVLTLLAIVVGVGSLGTVVPLMIPYFLSLPLQLGLCSFASYFASWIYQKLVVKE